MRDWYICLNPGIHTMVSKPNGLLCVVTGHDKATSWIASQAGPYNPSGKPRIVRYSNDRWTQCPEVVSQRDPSKVLSEYNIDRCALFVRTMRFALSPTVWMQDLLQNEPTHRYNFYYLPTLPVVGFRAVIQTMIDHICKSPNRPVSTMCAEACGLNFPNV